MGGRSELPPAFLGPCPKWLPGPAQQSAGTHHAAEHQASTWQTRVSLVILGHCTDGDMGEDRDEGGDVNWNGNGDKDESFWQSLLQQDKR